MKINILRYKELIGLDTTDISTDQFFELLEFQAIVESQVSYYRKEEYFLLIDKYFNQQIDSYEFRKLFLIMTDQDSANASIIYNDLHALENFKFANDLSKISGLLTKISMHCLDFDAIAYETEADIAKSEIQFHSLVKKDYLKLQKLLALSSKKNLGYDKLIFRSFKMLISIVGLEVMLVLAYFLVEN